MLPGSSIGQRLVLTSFGESHGRSIGAVLDGCPAGLEIDEKEIQEMLNQRKPGQNLISTQRKEGDIVEIVSGVFRGFTTGAPITMLIWNADQKSKDYENLKTKLRPGHSDYPAMVKYNQYNDHRGGGRFSGRLTATHVMGGAIARKLLKVTLGIKTNSFTSQIGKIKMEKEFNEKMSKLIYKNEVRCPEEKTAKSMRESILDAKKKGDSLGGIIESVTTNVPVGLGEPIFGSLESDLSKAIFSIPSVKGIEFGSGFRGSELFGSENNDLFTMKRGKIVTKTNNSGGILGGISNGMPITMRIAFKPVSSIAQKQSTVDIKNKKETILQVKGRHDPCVVPRAPPVVDSLVALTIADHALMAGTIKPTL
ncbi:MAG: chorismate synthase [Nitrosopumilus sp.]|jgi:chorismate synthase|nr:chorismate synthase [Nitrosopumilus sp.]MBT3573612.1 chorismate synthase [Nitrosopumilus sp.]MBT3862080.1 chorismate synthase [Nitrosopumilus sp.]MBT3956143.1 chorismate synthase [Nitrosopumilus sp.]MBT4955550.1 chorismate synthase [Nitrosopumilus sp.]